MNGKFKELEADFRSKLPERSVIGIRLDGKTFHNFTKQYERPFDAVFMKAMDETAIHIMNNLIMGAMFGYVQSDEITIFFTDRWNNKSEFVFDGKLEKILSTSASTATGAFMRAEPDCRGIPVFDARVFQIKTLEELQEYMDWRRLDARKNAITMASSTVKSHKELMNVSTRERSEFLIGTPYEKLPEDFFNGRLIIKKKINETVSFYNKGTGLEESVLVEREKLFSVPALRSETSTLVNSFEKLFNN